MKLRLYNPEVFQGNIKSLNYFEGWYFKNVSAGLDNVLSFIPGISLAKGDRHAFIQVIDGITCKSEYVTYPLDQFSWDRKKFSIRVGESIFTENHIKLNIDDDKIKVSGQLYFDNLIKYPKTLLSPGIMGWYSFVPLMECKHGIVSVNHNITGRINVDYEQIDFNGGKGYIEKDWGTSFPEAWIWCQANNFRDRNTSFCFSIAKIPWLGKFFTGLISFLYHNNKFYLYSTYNKSEVSDVEHSEGFVRLTLKNRDSVLKITTKQKSAGELKAPVLGNMTRKIKESIDSEVSIELYDKSDKLIYTDYSRRAGLEIIEKIFDYL